MAKQPPMPSAVARLDPKARLAAARAVAARNPDLPITTPDGRVTTAREALAEADAAVERAQREYLESFTGRAQ